MKITGTELVKNETPLNFVEDRKTAEYNGRKFFTPFVDGGCSVIQTTVFRVFPTEIRNIILSYCDATSVRSFFALCKECYNFSVSYYEKNYKEVIRILSVFEDKKIELINNFLKNMVPSLSSLKSVELSINVNADKGISTFLQKLVQVEAVTIVAHNFCSNEVSENVFTILSGLTTLQVVSLESSDDQPAYFSLSDSFQKMVCKIQSFTLKNFEIYQWNFNNSYDFTFVTNLHLIEIKCTMKNDLVKILQKFRNLQSLTIRFHSSSFFHLYSDELLTAISDLNNLENLDIHGNQRNQTSQDSLKFPPERFAVLLKLKNLRLLDATSCKIPIETFKKFPQSITIRGLE